MPKLYWLFTILLATPALGQSKLKNYLSDNVTAIRSIDPMDTSYADLEVIGNAIGEARVVMLGEQDHGDAPTFLAKTRLIKYLHEKKGFDVLAFESDFFALNEGWDQLVKEEDSIVQFLRKNIFVFWTNCRQCEDLFYRYIPSSFQTKTPLQVTGFDSQNHGRYSRSHLRNYIERYLESRKPAFLGSPLYESAFLKFLDEPYRFDPNTPISYFQSLEKIADTILSQLEGPANEFEILLLKSLKAYVKGRYTKSDNKFTNEIRDLQMAENLEWVVNKKYAGKKVIVWAANYHIMKNAVEAFEEDFHQRITMGDVFAKMPANRAETYMLGFTSRQGTAGRLYGNEYRLGPLARNSFESWINEDLQFGFTDFNAFNKEFPGYKIPFYMRAHWGDQLADWTKVFNGIFYIRDMYRCEERK